MTSDYNNDNNPRVRILTGEDNEYNEDNEDNEDLRSLFGDLLNFNPSFNSVIDNNQFNQVVDFSMDEDPSWTINRFLRSVSNSDIVDNLLNGIMSRELRVENRMMEIAMRESLDQYKTQEKKPDVELCVEGELASEEHLDKSCVICKSDFEFNDKITVLECKHIHHTECITEWVKYKSECPTCRAKIHTTFNEQEEKNIDEDQVG